MNLDRTAYLRTIYNTTALDESMLQVLVLMATLCDPERRLPVRRLSQPAIMTRLHWGIERTRNATRRLKEAGLLQIVRHDRHQHYQLPSEDELARYIAPPNPQKKLKHEKLSSLARAAQIQARKKVSH